MFLKFQDKIKLLKLIYKPIIEVSLWWWLVGLAAKPVPRTNKGVWKCSSHELLRFWLPLQLTWSALPVIKNNKIGKYDQRSYPQNVFEHDNRSFEVFIFFGIKKRISSIALHIV